MRIVVVGGGIVGLSSALALARRGAEVVVCEKGSVGAGSTPRSVGGIRTQFSTRVNVALSLASLPTWESFEDEFGVDIAFRQAGYLFLARSPRTADALADQVALQREVGTDTRLLEPAEVSEISGGIRTELLEAATYNPRNGFADPYLALQGYAGAVAEADGADLRTKTPVTEIHTAGGEVVGVTVEDPDDGPDRLEADAVVNAAGPWARQVAAMAGLDIPVAPRRRQMLVVEPETPVPEDDPLTIDLDGGGSHFRPERDGNAIVGGFAGDEDPDADPDRYSESYDLDWAMAALDRADEYATYFGPETRIRRGWAGLYAITPDHHPIIEESVPGFVQAVGFSGHGFQQAPATGAVVAELVLDGAASTVDVSRLTSDRFESGELLEERNVA